jgi:hypothetical protein
MAEELVMNVKSNIKSITKDTQDWGKALDDVNEEISIQNEEIVRQERLLIKLKAKQDAIPKGGWVAGMDKLNDKIRKTSDLIDLEKNTLKELTNKQKEATQEVKKSTVAKKGNNKESANAIADFKLMGVSLNDIKKGFLKIIPAAKAMFGTIKAGMISTGIGALVVAVAALSQTFVRSEEGQERFQRIMAAIGAVTSQVLDAFSDLGEIIIDTFKDPLPAMKKFGIGLLKFLRDPTGATRDMFIKATLAYKDFNEETSKEIDALIKVTEMRQKAHHIDRKLKVERANANREINDIRLKAEDRENQSATERIALLRKAQAIEEGITAKEIKSKKILIDAQVFEMAQGKNNIEQKDKLAQLQADLINLDTKKLRSQRLLQTQITTAVNEEKAQKQKLIDDEEAAFAKKVADNDAWNKKQLADAQKVADGKKLIAQKLEDTKKATLEMGAAAAMKIAGEGSAVGKAVAVSMAIMNTKEAVTAALGMKPYGPWNIAQAIATGIFGMTQVQGIINTPTPGGGGGGSAGSIGAAPQTPAPQMMSGAFELTGGQPLEPTRAYVVSDDITNNQNKLAIIRRRATI